MIILGIIFSILTGGISQITTTTIDSAEAATTLVIQMIGIICMWMGLMRIAENSGLINQLSIKLAPLLNFLFPELKGNSKILNYIATNLIANALGLGWAATPAGILAMKEMQKLAEDKKTATKSMCMFMILNMSFLQLISVTVLADRAAAGSVDAAIVIGPGIIVTTITTIVAIIVAKAYERSNEEKIAKNKKLKSTLLFRKGD
ncbi:MAG: nucleoside recognition protein [Defluviitaleaceae bacterium]|nr:nucleoside recognition protein [Defluviitaleaceae bacterium]